MKNNGYRASPSYTLTLRLKLRHRPGTLARAMSVISRSRAAIGAVDLVASTREAVVRDVTVETHDEVHGRALVEALKRLSGVEVVNVSDRTFLMHLGGKITVEPRTAIKTREDLTMAYTPGVARICRAIHENPESAWALTMKRNMAAIVTDGSRVLGLGRIGPQAALPVMEGKAMLFKTFGGVDAFPLCLNTSGTEELIAAVKALAPGFGAINLEDIEAPRCFEVEARLRAELDIPVFHDDQHGTAVVALAALYNALRLVAKDLSRVKIVINGAGAAGAATAKLLLKAGARRLVCFDRSGAIYQGRSGGMNWVKAELARLTNRERFSGSLASALRGAEVFIGLSGPGLLRARDLSPMAKNPIVFALANPEPEISPEETSRYVRIVATGRSDYPNQVNNALAFPGIFRGALDVRARAINDEMNLAAARAIAQVVGVAALREDAIVPSIFNPRVAPEVAMAVRRAAIKTGSARAKTEALHAH